MPAYGCGSTSWSSQIPPPRPKISEWMTGIPDLARTACTWSLQLVRWPTSLCRYLVTSRSPRTSGGAIHASGSLPIRSRSARSMQSRSSFLTLR